MKENLRRKIILAADDFGLSEKANERIIELAKLGKLDRVSIMVDGIFKEEEIKDILNSKLEIDIHFDLVNKIERDGIFGENPIKRIIHFVFHYFTRRAEVKSIKNDWLRQIEKFQNIFGKSPQGINSHQHIHFFPPYFKVAVKIAKNKNIQYIRFGKKGFLGNSTIVFLVLSFFRKRNFDFLNSSKLESSDYLASADWIKNTNRFLSKLPEGKTELVFHPEKKKEFEIIKKYF